MECALEPACYLSHSCAPEIGSFEGGKAQLRGMIKQNLLYYQKNRDSYDYVAFTGESEEARKKRGSQIKYWTKAVEMANIALRQAAMRESPLNLSNICGIDNSESTIDHFINLGLPEELPNISWDPESELKEYREYIKNREANSQGRFPNILACPFGADIYETMPAAESKKRKRTPSVKSE